MTVFEEWLEVMQQEMEVKFYDKWRIEVDRELRIEQDFQQDHKVLLGQNRMEEL